MFEVSASAASSMALCLWMAMARRVCFGMPFYSSYQYEYICVLGFLQ